MTSSKQFDDGAFTPRHFPLDPFDGLHPSREPWALDPSSLSDDELSVQPKVLIVLGEPPLDAIAPLLHSPHLVSSLLILATARSYSFPPNTSPALGVLRLSVPLTASNSAASRLVNVLQWAERIACVWRTHPTPPQFQEFTEDGLVAGYVTPPNRTSWFGTSPASSSALPSPASSELGLSLALTPPHSLSRTSKRNSVITSSPSTPIVTSKQHAFDALFNFLPPDVPDRHLLKQAILVTTVSRPFLTCTVSTPAPLKQPKRFSFRSRSNTSKSIAPERTLSPAHVIHLVPPLRSALIHPLESFCLTFSYPNVSCRSAPSLGLLPVPSRIDMGTPGPAPRPFIMPTPALGDVLHVGRKWLLCELILAGALDGDNDVSMDEFGAKRKETVTLRSLAKSNRAWINGVGDLVLKNVQGRARVLSEHSIQPTPRLPYITPDSPAGVAQRPLSVVHVQPYVQPEASPSREPYSWHVQPSSPPHSYQQRPRPHPQVSRVPLTSHPSMSSSSSHSSHSHTLRTTSTHRPTQAVSASTSTFITASPSSSTPSTSWPTPPSSTSSSPSTSPDLGAKRDGAVVQHMNANANGSAVESKRNAPALLTPLYDDTGSSRGSTSVRKRKGLFAWIKR